MMIAGMAGLLQILLLPGLIVFKIWKVRLLPVQRLAVLFAASLTSNYMLVLLLAALKIYTRPVLITILVVEAAALLYLYRQSLVRPVDAWLAGFWQETAGWLRSWLPDPSPTDRPALFWRILRAVLLIAAAGIAFSLVLWAVRIFYFNIGSIFNAWDAVVSWNEWAARWAQNTIPAYTREYPQLIPTNWSITYVLMGSAKIQFFAKAIMPVFILLILALIFEMGLSRRSLGLFLAVIATQLIMKKFLGEFVAEGYVDIPLAFFSLLAVNLLFRNLDQPFRFEMVWLGLLASAAAAVTKQPGLFLLAVYPVLAFLTYRREFIAAFRQERQAALRAARPALLAALAAGLVVLPWYVIKWVGIQAGTEESNLGWLTSGIYQGASLASRLSDAVGSLEKYAFVLLFVVLSLVVLRPAYRWLVLLLVVPWVTIWAFLFSYDTRNLALALPLLGLTAGVAAGRWFELAFNAFSRLRLGRAPAWALVLLAAVALALPAFFITAGELENRQVELQKQLFSPELNQKMYTAFGETGQPDVRILTNYPLAHLPGFEENQVVFWYDEYALYQSYRDGGEIDYLLVPSYADGDIQDDIEQRLQNGDYEFIFEDDRYVSYRLIKINR